MQGGVIMKVYDVAFLLLKRNKKNHFIYGLTLLFSIVVCFIFIDFIDNPILIETDQVRGILDPQGFNLPLSKGLPFVIITFTWSMILYASQYYFKQKDQEYSLLIISGMNLVSHIKYALCQIGLILGAVIPLSFITGTLSLFLIKKLIYDYLDISHSIFNIRLSTYITTMYALFMLVLVIIVVLIGTIHKTSILSLKKTHQKHKYIKQGSRISLVYVLIYIYCLCHFFIIKNDWIYYEINSIVGMLAAYGILKKCIGTLLNYLKKKYQGKDTFICLSHFHLTLNSTSSLVFLMTIIVTGILPILALQNPLSNEYVTGIISFLFIITLLLISIIYKLNIEMHDKVYEYVVLEKIGYTKKQLIQMIVKENVIYYTLILCIPLPYLFSITYQYLMKYHISMTLLIVLFLFYLVAIIFSLLITNKAYQNTFITRRKIS